MANEQLQPGPNLLEKLSPVLTQVRALSGDRAAQYGIVRSWFEEHPENLARNMEDLALVCTLPREERILLTGPLIGSWFIDRMSSYVPQTSSQATTLGKLITYIELNRFIHGDMDYDSPQEDWAENNRRFDELAAATNNDPVGGTEIVSKLRAHFEEFVNDIFNNVPKLDSYTVDLGHGLGQYAQHICMPVTDVLARHHEESREPLDVSIMVVDDQSPEDWYNRMVAQGFKDVPGQQGFFLNCESALVALETGNYDVVLTDLDLGEGNMGGIEFIERAYEIQRRKGIIPRISAFSYSDALLAEAERRLRGENPKVFQRVSWNNKTIFNCFGFRRDVNLLLHSEKVHT
jgi:CheY-like chemotaxis protein